MIKVSCSNITMNQFIDCLIGEVVWPGGNEEWEEIHNEYIGLRENKSSQYILSLIKEMSYLKAKIFIILTCTKNLSETYCRDLVNELKRCGCKGKFNREDKVSYSSDLQSAISYSKKYILQLERKRKELEDYYKRHGGSSIQRKDFEIWKVTIGRFMGFRIDYNVVTVSEFCHMMNSYEKFCEVSNAEQNNLLSNKEHG